MGRENLMFVKGLCQFTEKKKRKKSSRSLRTESGAKLAMDCYVAVYYASGRERKREREKERELQDIQWIR